MSARSDLRDAFLTRLQAAAVAGHPLDGYLVEASRGDPVDDSEPGETVPPFVFVYADEAVGETLSDGLYGAAFAERSVVNVAIKCGVWGPSWASIEASLDGLEDDLRTLLLGDQSLLNLMRAHPQVGVSTRVFWEGGRLRGMMVLLFVCPSVAAEVA